MPFCTHCGSQVDAAAAYCSLCGNRQAGGATGAGKAEPWLESIDEKTASILCYVPFAGWIACLVFLATQKFRMDQRVRFHAFQGLYLFVVWMLVDMAVTPFFGFGAAQVRKMMSGFLHAAVLGVWIYMLYKTSTGETVELPVLGELAQRSVAEQSSDRR
jgi:uncharacterized membrane protein